MNFITEPWQHQRDLVEKYIRDKCGYLLFWEMGTGKTKAMIDVLRYQFGMRAKIVNTIIIGPPIVIKNWTNEFKVHSKIVNVVPLQGPVKKRLAKAEAALQKNADRGTVLVTNYEALLNKSFMDFLVKRFKAEIIVLDEIHRIKNPQSKRFRACIKLGDSASLRYGLTGSPILRNQMDLFTQFRFVDKGETFGKSFTEFKYKYFMDANAGMPKNSYFPNWKFRPSMNNELQGKLRDMSMSVVKSECLDLPPLVKRKVFTTMAPDQARAYREMVKDLVTFIKDKKDDVNKPSVAAMTLTKTLRLMQIVSGFASVENDGEVNSNVLFEKNPKAEALQEILEQNAKDRKIIVWAIFKEDYKTIAKLLKKLGIKYVEVHGGISAKNKDKAVFDFNNDKETRVFLGHPKAGGIGINLTVSDLQVYFSRGFSLEDDMQSEARNYRGGSEIHESITRVDILMDETIDEQILDSLQAKQQIGADLIFNMELK